ncbi:MAG: DUF192 domain-containing protein [bacterium]
MKSCTLAILIAFILLGCRNGNHEQSSSQNSQTVSEDKQPKNNKLHTIHIDSVPLDVEIAQDEETLMSGLMYREELPENQGMLFVFQNQRILSFWMRNTFIPLDIAFINRDGMVVDIQQMAPLDETKQYISSAPALYALEVNAGWFEEHRLKIGSRVQF